VKELMYKTGFTDESAFTQYCKRHFGKVPSQIINERRQVKDAL
jgi:AraC-like DNA-binding protein